jgi:hypothetical protein
VVQKYHNGEDNSDDIYNDLKKCSFVVYNDMARKVRSGWGGDPFCHRVTCRESAFIEDVPMLEEKISSMEMTAHRNVNILCFDCENRKRLPEQAKDMKSFSKKKSVVKDSAIDIVVEACTLFKGSAIEERR